MTQPRGDTGRPRSLDDALEVEDLVVRFDRLVVIDRLTFGVARGASLAVIGPNGAGKTVLFRALIGAVPHEGSVRWAEGTRIGYVPQKLDLERDLPVTGADLLRAKAQIAGAEDSEIAAALAAVSLRPERASVPVGALSGGQFQRLLVALALVGRPTVLMLDEPTAGVDEPGQQRLHDLLDRVRVERGITVMLISHDLSVVYRHASSVLCLGQGPACFGPPRTVLTPDVLQQVYGSPVGFHVHDDDAARS